MIDELLRAFGIRTGRYTSPHLESVTERIVVDGEPITEQAFVEAYREIEPYVDMIDARSDVPLSFFEIVTALAFAVFADTPVDVGVIEVGLGGTWDNTNVVDAEIAVVTPIGLDHTQYLGDTVDRIAGEKAGIIKADSVAILSSQPASAAEVLLRRAVEVGASVAREGLEFGVLQRGIAGRWADADDAGPRRHLRRGVPPAARRAPGAETPPSRSPRSRRSSEPARKSGPIDADIVRAAFAQVRSPGRLEAVCAQPRPSCSTSPTTRPG